MAGVNHKNLWSIHLPIRDCGQWLLLYILSMGTSHMLLTFCMRFYRFGKEAAGEIVHDSYKANITYCIYDLDVATGGVGAFLFLFSSQSLLTPGRNRAWSIIYFASSWLTFSVASACLIAGATKNAYHTKFRHVIYAQSWTCESLRKGVFMAGAGFVVFTMILNVYCCMYFAKATSQAARKTSRASSTVGMAGCA